MSDVSRPMAARCQFRCICHLEGEPRIVSAVGATYVDFVLSESRLSTMKKRSLQCRRDKQHLQQLQLCMVALVYCKRIIIICSLSPLSPGFDRVDYENIQ